MQRCWIAAEAELGNVYKSGCWNPDTSDPPYVKIQLD